MIRQIEIGKEFRVRISNNRIIRVKSNFSGTPIFIRCTSGTSIIPPIVILIPEENIAEIRFQDHYLMGVSYTFVIDELERTVKTYEKPQVKRSIAGQQYFRHEINESQESLNQKFSVSNALSFDQSYFLRTIGQLLIQHKFEKKYGSLLNQFKLFSGAGFGSLQAFNAALGYETNELNQWYLTELLDLFDKSLIKVALKTTVSISSLGFYKYNNDKYETKAIEKAIRNYFRAKDIQGKRTNKDLLIKDCKAEIYIPVWDISRRTLTITKQTFPDMPIFVAVISTLFDPIFFKTKPILENMGVMAGDVVKNNDVYLREYNPNLSVISIGSPVRMFDKGCEKVELDDREILIKLNDIKHDTDLDWSRSCGSKRYECTPIDECRQFQTDELSIKKAQNSGNIDVI